MLATFFFITLLLTSLPQILGAGVVRQKFTSSDRLAVSVNLKENLATVGVPKIINMTLAANDTSMVVYRIEGFEKGFEYRLVLRSPLTGEVLHTTENTNIAFSNNLEVSRTFKTTNGILLTVKTMYFCQPGYYGDKCDQYNGTTTEEYTFKVKSTSTPKPSLQSPELSTSAVEVLKSDASSSRTSSDPTTTIIMFCGMFIFFAVIICTARFISNPTRTQKTQILSHWQLPATKDSKNEKIYTIENDYERYTIAPYSKNNHKTSSAIPSPPVILPPPTPFL